MKNSQLRASEDLNTGARAKRLAAHGSSQAKVECSRGGRLLDKGLEVGGVLSK